MISNVVFLEQVRSTWNTVRISQARVETNTVAGHLGGGVLTPDFINFAHSLVLIFAYSVLEDVLNQLFAEKVFKSKKINLMALMQSSRTSLPWADYSIVDTGRERRNDVAHRQVILSKQDCNLFIDAIETELLTWHVIPNRVRGRYSVTRSVS